MSRHVQPARPQPDPVRQEAPAPLAPPYAVTGDAEVAALLARGRTLQGRAVRRAASLFARVLLSAVAGGLQGRWGRPRERYGRSGPVRPCRDPSPAAS
jgi:hypothetical protein